MKRRKRISGLGDAGGIVMGLLPIAAGILAGKILEKQFLTKDDGTVNESANLIKIGVGVLGAAFTKGMIAGLASGVAIDGVVEFVSPSLKTSGMINLLPPGAPARYMAGFVEGKTFDGQQFPFRGFP